MVDSDKDGEDVPSETNETEVIAIEREAYPHPKKHLEVRTNLTGSKERKKGQLCLKHRKKQKGEWREIRPNRTSRIRSPRVSILQFPIRGLKTFLVKGQTKYF